MACGGERSRSEAGRLLKDGLVCVDGQLEKDPARKVDPSRQRITIAGEPLADQRLQYVMFHKPAGVLTAARDSRAPTVMDWLPPALLRRKVLPVGRLDKDATGLLLLTNDGALAHRLLAPGCHVSKEYHATVAGALTPDDVAAFAMGIPLGDFTARPAKLSIISSSQETSQAILWLQEGKFHQVKRMFAALGHPVQSLHRAAFGPLRLDAALAPGAWQALTCGQVEALRQAVFPPAGSAPTPRAVHDE